MTPDRPLLEIENLSKSFRGIQAVVGFSLFLQPGEILGLIGPNGAGKTTVINLLSGLLQPSGGSIRFAGRDITHLSPERIADLGVARTFQDVRLFGSMTVLDNVRTAGQQRNPAFLAETLLSWPSFFRRERCLAQQAQELLGLFKLQDRVAHLAGSLAYGDQRRLEIARALALGPQLLLLDEPVAGMNPEESWAMLEELRAIRLHFDLTMIVVEHDMSLVMRLCHRIQVLDHGETIACGRPQEIRTDPRVIEAYLGQEEGQASHAAA